MKRLATLTVSAAVVVMALAGRTDASAINSRFNPNSFASNGPLSLASGDTLDFDTSALTYEINSGGALAGGAAATSQSGLVELAMFNFESVNIPGGVTITVTGDRGLVIGSLEDIILGSDIDVSGTAAVNNNGAKGRGGPGAEGGVRATSFDSAPPPGDAGDGGGVDSAGTGYGAGKVSGKNGEGASYGGKGGVADGDLTYGDAMLTDLFGGSGGAGSDGGYATKGGGGGGAIELTAMDTIALTAELLAGGGKGSNRTSPGGKVRRGAGGGSGGAILLNAPNVILSAGSLLDVSGGDHGIGKKGNNVAGNFGGGGGGGRIAIYANSLTQLGTIDVGGGSEGGWNAPEDGTFQTGEFGAVIPEPATLAMLGLAFAGLGGYVRKRRRGA